MASTSLSTVSHSGCIAAASAARPGPPRSFRNRRLSRAAHCQSCPRGPGRAADAPPPRAACRRPGRLNDRVMTRDPSHRTVPGPSRLPVASESSQVA